MDKTSWISGIVNILVGLYNLGLAIWMTLTGASAIATGALFFVSGSLLTLGIVFLWVFRANALRAKENGGCPDSSEL